MVLSIDRTTLAWGMLGIALTAFAAPAGAQTQAGATSQVRRAERITASAPAEPRRAVRQASTTQPTRPATVGFGSNRTVSHTTLPRAPRTMRTMMQEEVIVDDSVYEDVSDHVGMHVDGGCESCGDGCSDGSCGTSGCSSCAEGCLVPCPQITFRNMEFFAGVEGFKGQPDRGRGGSFGFNGGANVGFGLPCLTADIVSAQLGVNSVQSNFSGSDFTDLNRDQLFVTGGLFRRVDYGLQGGAVIDYLHESWNTERNVAQVRGLLSWVYEGGDEFGFQLASPIHEDLGDSLVDGVVVTETWRTVETYSFFYRHTFDACSGTNARLIGGWGGDGETLLGADFWTPLNDRWAIDGGFAYLLPDADGVINESWNVGMNLVWYPSGLGHHRGRYHRPLFNVANNGSMMMQVE